MDCDSTYCIRGTLGKLYWKTRALSPVYHTQDIHTLEFPLAYSAASMAFRVDQNVRRHPFSLNSGHIVQHDTANNTRYN